MQTMLPRTGDDLQTLTAQLQMLSEDIPLGIRCICRNRDLIILGQHQPGISLNVSKIFRFLERKIQSLQIQCAQRVRLYLRVAGQDSPYASRQFTIQPPPPPPLEESLDQETPKEKWYLADEDIDAWLSELGATGTVSGVDPGLPGAANSAELTLRQATDLTLESPTEGELTLPPAPSEDPDTLSLVPYSDLDTDPTLVARQRLGKLNPRWAIASGAATLGLVGGAYLVTRPCSLATCPQLQTARSLEQESLAALASGRDPAALEAAQQSLGRAVALLETIPLWSSHKSEATALMSDYEEKATTLEQLIYLENRVTEALPPDLSQPQPVEDWQAARNALTSIIGKLEDIQPDHEFYTYARQKLNQYQIVLARVNYQFKQETEAQAALDNAQQTVKLAETRQTIARSLENWQLVRATWQVVMMRLEDIAAGQTIAAQEAERLMDIYQARLDAANQQVDAEQLARRLLQQGQQRAQEAEVAQERFQWRQALVDWEAAIAFIEEIPQETSQHSEAQSLLNSYKQFRDEVQDKLEATARVARHLTEICDRELQRCSLLAVDQSIRLQLDQDYVSAIEVARATGNRDLQAIVTEHQLALREALVAIATEFELPVEVYSPAQTLLDRHLPEG
jgi:hypothetical protein